MWTARCRGRFKTSLSIQRTDTQTCVPVANSAYISICYEKFSSPEPALYDTPMEQETAKTAKRIARVKLTLTKRTVDALKADGKPWIA